MTNSINPPAPESYSSEMQDLWLCRILLDDSLWHKLRFEKLNRVDLEKSSLMTHVMGSIKESAPDIEYDDELSKLTFEELGEREAADLFSVHPLFKDTLALGEQRFQGKVCLSDAAENNLRVLQEANGLTEAEARCLYWVLVCREEPNFVKDLVYTCFDLDSLGLPFYMKLCSSALEVPYDKVVAALSPVDGTLIRRKFVQFSANNSRYQTLDSFFETLDYEKTPKLTSLAMTKEEWIGRWLTPVKTAIDSLDSFNDYPGVKSFFIPMLTRAIEQKKGNLHIVVRAKDKTLARLFASHMANAVNATLCKTAEGYNLLDKGGRSAKMFSNMPLILLTESGVNLSHVNFATGQADVGCPCIWTLEADDFLSSVEVYPVIDLQGREEVFRCEAIAKFADGLLTMDQCRLISRVDSLPVESAFNMIKMLRAVNADENMVEEAVEMLTSNLLRYND